MAQIGLAEKSKIDADIRAVFVTTDVNTRQSLYKEILTTLHNEAVYLPIYYMTMFEVHRTAQLEDVRFGNEKHHIFFEDIKIK